MMTKEEREAFKEWKKSLDKPLGVFTAELNEWVWNACWKNHVEPLKKEMHIISDAFMLAVKNEQINKEIIEKLVEGLEFYEDEDNWSIDIRGNSIWDDGSEVCWRKARTTLEEVKKMREKL